MAASATDLLQEMGLPGSATTLASGYTQGDPSITVASTTNMPSATGFTFAIDRVDSDGVRIAGTYNEFVGTVDTSTTITNVSKVYGTAQDYASGATTRVFIPFSSERENRIVEWGVVEHNQDGTHSSVTADDITVTDLTVTGDLTVGGVGDNGWVATGGTHSVATTYNAGNRSFTIDTSTDISGIVSEGMRYKVTRGTTPPTQCADLEASSSQYASNASPSGITFTDDFTCEGWVKLESYGTTEEIVSMYDGTTGWFLRVRTDGTIQIGGILSSGNSRSQLTYQFIPLNKWVHVAAHLDMSGDTGAIYIDGVSVPIKSANAGTATSLTQAGSLQVGAYNGANFFDGKLADVRVWSDIRNATEIQDNMYAYPSDTTGLVGHFKLNGDFTDSSSNGNDLTAQNSAVATNADNPWNATEYGIITAVSATDIQVFCPEGYGIPNETLSSPFYSTQSAPYGFPRDEGRWELQVLSFENIVPTVSATPQDSNLELQVPVGAWSVTLDLFLVITSSTTGSRVGNATLSTDGSTETNVLLTGSVWSDEDAATSVSHGNTVACRESVSLSASTTYTLLMYVNNVSNVDSLQTRGDNSTTIIRAISAYL